MSVVMNSTGIYDILHCLLPILVLCPMVCSRQLYTSVSYCTVLISHLTDAQ